ncbi:MAG: hypothetical protein ACI4SR_01500 [Faecalibacillus sp.]
MNFQEKYNEYKQRKEAKKFFNQNNDYHLELLDYIKVCVAGILAGTAATIIFNVIMVQMSVSLSIFYLLMGYAVGYAVLKVAKYGSEKTGIISLVCYFLGLWIGESFFIAYTFSQLYLGLSVIDYLYAGANALLHSGFITYLFIFAGAFIAYSIGKD